MTEPGPSLAPVSGVAIDFGGTKISAARLVDGKEQARAQVATDGNAAIDAQIDAICGLLDDLELAIDEPVGVALAGRVDADGVWYAVNTETLTKVNAVPLRALLEARLKRPVTVQNDAIAAAIGEYFHGAGKGSHAMGYLTVSTGVGGGFVLDGRPLISANGLAGHVGFTTSRVAKGRCGCGREKTVESIAGGRALVAKAAAAGHPGLTGKDIFEAHLGGEAWARAIVETSAAAVAELCANLKSLLDLDRIVMGGSIGLAEGYRDLVLGHLQREPALFQVDIEPARLGAASAHFGILTRFQ